MPRTIVITQILCVITRKNKNNCYKYKNIEVAQQKGIKTMKSKMLSLILAGVLAVSVLAGCTKAPTDSSSEGSSEGSSSTESSSSAEDKDETVNTVTGTITDATMNEITIETADGTTYTFAKDEAIDVEDGSEIVGGVVEISYTGEITDSSTAITIKSGTAE